MTVINDIGTVSPQRFRRLVLSQLEDLDTPRSLSIWMLLKAGQDESILDLEIDPLWFKDSKSYLEFALPSSLVKKWVGLRVANDPKLVAKQTFFDMEGHCRIANRRIRTDTPKGRVGSILDKARKIISDILPEIDARFLDSLGDLGGWGKGVTSSCKGRWLAPYNKLGAAPQATPAFLTVAKAFILECPQWSRLHSDVEVCPFNTVSFVPKTAKTDRAIAVEPSMNAFFQRAVGKSLHLPLKKLGIFLDSQEKNRLFARRASIDNSLATIDLSSASDTISKAIVEYLFPREWVALLGLLRSEHFKIDGEIHRYEKWSSMGNGYTFELESLLFGSICMAIVGHPSKWCVYGDDIIVPIEHYDILAECLEWCGFIINKSKSFSSGPFRESCGEDFFLGDRVRPFFLKEESVPAVFAWANYIRTSVEYKSFCIDRTWKRLVESIPRAPLGPKGDYGLLTFWVNDYEYDPSYSKLVRRPYGPWIGFYIEGLRWEPQSLRRSKIDGDAAVAAHLRQLTASRSADRFPLAVSASGSGKWKRRRTVFSEDWPQLRAIT